MIKFVIYQNEATDEYHFRIVDAHLKTVADSIGFKTQNECRKFIYLIVKPEKYEIIVR